MISNKNKNLIYQFLFGLIIFLVPSNLFFKFFESSAYVNGLLIDYLIPKLYLSDLIILTLLLWWLFDHKKIINQKIKKIVKQLTIFGKKNKLISFLLIAIFLRQFNTDHNLSAYWYIFKIFEFTFLTYILIDKKRLITNTLILSSTLFTLFFQGLVTILQFFNQSSLIGYWFLGEPNLTKQIGLAKQTINGIEKILPYGTTAHPNILGGIIAVYLLLLIIILVKPQLKKKKYHQQLFVLGPIIISLIALGLTFSLSAWLTFIVGFILILKKLNTKKILLSSIIFILLVPLLIQLGSHFTDNPSVKRRAYLNQTAINMLKNNPIWGVGINNFTSRVEEYSPTREVVRFTQPSHHVLLLVFSEIGLLGIVTIILLAKRINKEKNKIKLIIFNNNFKKLNWKIFLLASMAPIISLDHYLITNQSGLLLIILAGIITKNSLYPPQK